MGPSLEDALADHDTIHAVILGSAINNDGSRKVGYLAPSVDGQAEVVAEALGVAGDMFIGISTSGKSPNIVRAFQACAKKGIIRVGFTGQGGVEMAPYCDYCLVVPSRETPRVQEAHILIAHIFCALVEEDLFGKGFAT